MPNDISDNEQLDVLQFTSMIWENSKLAQDRNATVQDLTDGMFRIVLRYKEMPRIYEVSPDNRTLVLVTRTLREWNELMGAAAVQRLADKLGDSLVKKLADLL